MEKDIPPEVRRAQDHIVHAAAPDVREELKDWDFMTYRETGEMKLLEVLKAPGAPPALALMRLGDGTVRVLDNGEEINTDLRPDERMLEIQAETGVKAALITHLLTKMPGGPPSQATLDSESLRNTVSNESRTLWSELRERKKFPRWVRTETIRDIGFITDDVITNKEVRSLVKGLKRGHQEPSPRQYNAVALNLSIMKEAEETAPQVIRYYLNEIADEHRHPVKLGHAGEITAAVKHATGLTDGAWKTFTKVPHAAWSRGEHGIASQAAIEACCRILTLANVRIQEEQRVIKIVEMLARPANLQMLRPGLEWSHGNPDQPWADLVREYLPKFIPHSMFHDDSTHREAEHIADAIRDTVRHNQPWGKGDWETLVRRANQWQTDRISREERERALMAEKMAESSWSSLISDVTLGEYDFIPVTKGDSLMELGQEMNNCLANFYQDCERGTSRIFEVRKDEALVAAVELQRGDAGWEIGQMEGPRRSACPRKVKRAAEELNAQYNQAFRWEMLREGV